MEYKLRQATTLKREFGIRNAKILILSVFLYSVRVLLQSNIKNLIVKESLIVGVIIKYIILQLQTKILRYV